MLGHKGTSARNRNGCLRADAELNICTQGQLMKKETDLSLWKEMVCKIPSAAVCTRYVCALFPKFLSKVEPTQQPPASHMGDFLRESGGLLII